MTPEHGLHDAKQEYCCSGRRAGCVLFCLAVENVEKSLDSRDVQKKKNNTLEELKVTSCSD